jgi:hypothetical protein
LSAEPRGQIHEISEEVEDMDPEFSLEHYADRFDYPEQIAE